MRVLNGLRIASDYTLTRPSDTVYPGASDGSLTTVVQAGEPNDAMERANWLLAPKGDFSLYMRAYWPKAEVLDGSWTPPAVQKLS